MTRPKLPLVVVVDGVPLASTEIIAEGFGQDHASVMKLLRKHQSHIEQLGPLRFQIRVKRDNGSGEPTQYAMLTEPQAALLISLMRNLASVLDFKVALVKDFFRMRDAIQQGALNNFEEMKKFIAKESRSEARATIGSLLMHARRKEKPGLVHERALLEEKIQPSLFLH